MTKQAINTRTQEEYDALMRYYESKGIEWGAFGQATNCPEFWEEDRELTCVTTEHREGVIEYAHTEFFVEKGYEIIPYTEFAANIEPDWKALYLEGNKILREVSVRCNLIFPETEEEVKWFEEKTQKSGDLLIRLLEYLTKHNTPNN